MEVFVFLAGFAELHNAFFLPREKLPVCAGGGWIGGDSHRTLDRAARTRKPLQQRVPSGVRLGTTIAAWRPMKRFGILALLVACSASPVRSTAEDASAEGALNADALAVPFYFSMPRAALGDLPSIGAGGAGGASGASAYRIATIAPRETSLAEHAGLHVIAVPDRSSAEGRRQVRRDMTKNLAEAGVLRDGDVVVGVRFHQKDSVPYVHLQMGAQHTALVFTREGVPYHVDEPLDLEHMRFDPPATSVPAVRPRASLGPASSFTSRKIVSQFDADAYTSTGTAGMPMLHIVRPRFIDATRTESMRRWIERIGERWEYLQAAGVLKYNANFLAPVAPRLGGTKKSVTILGKTLLGDELPQPGALAMYCSELSWHLLALSNCSDEDVHAAGPEGAACASDTPFALQPMASTERALGFTDGPLAVIRSAGLSADENAALLGVVFPAHPDASRLTTLHRRMNDSFRELIPVMASYYRARVDGAANAWTLAADANHQLGDVLNYSPSSYLVEAMRPAAERRFDYVATVVFVDP